MRKKDYYEFEYESLKELIYDATKLYWHAFNSLSHRVLNQLLSPDCRMQSDYGECTKGVNGIIGCLNKIAEIHSQICKLNISESVIRLNVISHTHTTILVIFDINSTKMSVAFSLHWECTIIVGIVFMKEVDQNTFVRDMLNLSSNNGKHSRQVSRLSKFNSKVSGLVLYKDEINELGVDDICNDVKDDGSYACFGIEYDTSNNESHIPLLTLQQCSHNNINNIKSCLKDSNLLDGNEVRSEVQSEQQSENKSELKKVNFDLSINIILIPKVKKELMDDELYYSSFDYKSFKIQSHEEINLYRYQHNVPNMPISDVLRKLYQNNNSEINSIIDDDNNTIVVSIQDILYKVSILYMYVHIF
jgi:hypothetical protein